MELGPILRSLWRNKVRFGLIVAEVALTLAIVANCVAMILAARSEMARESGFDDENMIWARSVPFTREFREDQYLDNSAKEDLAALRSLPGVVAATHTALRPWQGGGSATMLRVLGAESEPLRTQSYGGDEQTFAALGVDVVEGRGFTPEEVDLDPNAGTRPVVVSRAYADLLFPDGKAVGRSLQGTRLDRSYPIVGVIDRFYNPYSWKIGKYATFFAGPSGTYAGGVRYLVRTRPGQRESVYGMIEDRLLALNGGRNVELKTISEVKDEFLVGQKTLVWSLNAVIALLVAVTAVGIVGLTAFSVTERTRQIGTRRALGARRADILRYFLLENWMITSLGVSLGLVAAYGLNVALVSLVTEARLDWRLLAAGVALLWGTGLVAALGPALRASRIAPAVATRNQ